jgi:hypothetical protein
METPINDEEHLCPVCLEEILPTDGQALTECCHNVFHLSCMILTYTRRDHDKTKCPMCRGHICHELIPVYDEIIDQNGLDLADNLSSPHPEPDEMPVLIAEPIPYSCESELYGLSYNTIEYDRYVKIRINVTEKSTNYTTRHNINAITNGNVYLNFINESCFYMVYNTNSRVIIRQFSIISIIDNHIALDGFISFDDFNEITHVQSSIDDSSGINRKLIINIDYIHNSIIHRATKNIDVSTFVEVV